jgi:hypothetical protein
VFFGETLQMKNAGKTPLALQTYASQINEGLLLETPVKRPLLAGQTALGTGSRCLKTGAWDIKRSGAQCTNRVIRGSTKRKRKAATTK